jgi:hypothetical protein
MLALERALLTAKPLEPLRDIKLLLARPFSRLLLTQSKNAKLKLERAEKKRARLDAEPHAA